MSNHSEITELIEKYTRDSAYQELHWEGSIAEYLKIVGESPAILRNAFQRIYDMIVSYGMEEYTENKEKLVRYKFFSDPENEGEDAVYGLEKPLMHLVNIFKSASRHYGTERRVLLLHGPVGSAKSTIVRLLKKGLEAYSRIREGALYTFAWRLTNQDGEEVLDPCPMHEEPLHLMPKEIRIPFLESMNGKLDNDLKIFIVRKMYGSFHKNSSNGKTDIYSTGILRTIPGLILSGLLITSLFIS